MFKELRDEYVKLASSKSVYNEWLNEILFFSAIGALMHKNDIEIHRGKSLDTRIHPFYIQDSRTGKGISTKIMQKFAENMGLTTTIESQFTDAGLTGTIKGDVMENNYKKGYLPQDPNYIDPLVVGDLGLYDILIFEEGVKMVKPEGHSEGRLEIFQGVMDTPGRIRKKLSSEGELNYECNATLVGTTYPLEEFRETVLRQGIFQRMHVGWRPVSQELRIKMNKAILDSITNVDDDDFNIELAEISDKVKEIITAFKGTSLELNPKGKKAQDSFINKIMNRISELKGLEYDLISPFTTINMLQNFKFSGVMAVLDESTKINRHNITEAQKLTMKSFESIIKNMLTTVDKSTARMDKAKDIIRNMTKVKARELKELQDKTNKKTGITATQCKKCIADLQKENYVRKVNQKFEAIK